MKGPCVLLSGNALGPWGRVLSTPRPLPNARETPPRAAAATRSKRGHVLSKLQSISRIGGPIVLLEATSSCPCLAPVTCRAPHPGGVDNAEAGAQGAGAGGAAQLQPPTPRSLGSRAPSVPARARLGLRTGVSQNLGREDPLSPRGLGVFPPGRSPPPPQPHPPNRRLLRGCGPGTCILTRSLKDPDALWPIRNTG